MLNVTTATTKQQRSGLEWQASGLTADEWSAAFDVNDKGYLSPVEERIRSMDKEGLGYLTNRQVRPNKQNNPVPALLMSN